MDKTNNRRSFDRLIFSDISASIFKNDWYYNLKYSVFGNFALFMPEKLPIQNLSSSGPFILA